jgi:hypothetical protein
MIAVRLIGGPLDGEVKKVDPGQAYLIAYKRTALPPITVPSGAPPSAVVTVEPHRYTRRVVHCSGKQIVFYAPEALSDYEALQHALGA